MTKIPKPQKTGSTTIEAPNEGVANGILSVVSSLREVEYDDEEGVYRVGEVRNP